LIDQEKIYNRSLIGKKRIEQLEIIGNSLWLLPDKQYFWNHFITLTGDQNSDVRKMAVKALGSAFSHVSNKEQAWENLIKLINDKDSDIRREAASFLGSAFSQVPNKKQAWNDLHRLVTDKDFLVRAAAVREIGSAFFCMPDKQQAWDDLIKLTNDDIGFVRAAAASGLGFAFSHVPDKQQGWDDFIQQAWDDLIRLINDDIENERSVAKALGSVFFYMPDKQQAWDDLHRLTNEENSDGRLAAAIGLGSAFFCMPNKQQAWDDLIKLTNDKNYFVKFVAGIGLGSAFSHVPDKEQAWNDLHRLITDKDDFVKSQAANALVFAFPLILDQQQAWNDLIKLTGDKGEYVRADANHSLGKISIFQASKAESEEEYKRELETAIAFFEKAAHAPTRMSNPSKFCLPFYRSFHTIIFKKQKAKKEVDKYLAEAKSAIGGSKSKELLFEAVNNLSNALTEVQSMGNLDLQAKKGELDFYRKYCDCAEELMRNAEESAPYATAAMRKGMPILDRYLKELIEEIQEKAKIACNESKETEAKEIACAVSREVQKWEISNQEEMTQKVEDAAYILKTKVADLPENKFILNKIEAMRHEPNLIKQYETLLFVIGQIHTLKVVSEKELDNKLLKFRKDMSGEIVGAKEEIIGEIVSAKEEITNKIVNIKDKLCCISFNVSNIGLNSYNIISNLDMIRVELKKLNSMALLSVSSTSMLDSNLTEQINDLNKIIQTRWNELESFINGLVKDDDTKKILSIVNELKNSKLNDLIQTPACIATLIGFLIQAIQVCQQCKLLS